MEEIWNDTEYNGYKVSNLGRVIGKRGNILKPIKHKNNYLFVGICIEKGLTKIESIHRLVAKAFIPNPLNLPCINHKDEDVTNNCVSNLEWCDHKYNNNYGSRTQKMAVSQRNDIKKSKRVEQYTKDGVFIREWPSCKEIVRQLGYLQGTVSSCCRGERKSAYGYIWRYS